MIKKMINLKNIIEFKFFYLYNSKFLLIYQILKLQ